MATVIDAWDAVSKRVQAWATSEASAKVAGEVKQIPNASFLSLKDFEGERSAACAAVERQLDGLGW